MRCCHVKELKACISSSLLGIDSTIPIGRQFLRSCVVADYRKNDGRSHYCRIGGLVFGDKICNTTTTSVVGRARPEIRPGINFGY